MTGSETIHTYMLTRRESLLEQLSVWDIMINGSFDEDTRQYAVTRRQCILIELGKIEDSLGLERTKQPNHVKRQHADPRRTRPQ
jgi:hypothetical protein